MMVFFVVSDSHEIGNIMLKKIELNKNDRSLVRILLACTYPKVHRKLDVSQALKRWRDKSKQTLQ